MARPYAKLRGLMREYDYSQGELAEELGIGARTLSAKINALSPWTLDEAYRLLQMFQIPEASLHELFPKNGQNEKGVQRGHVG